MSIMWSPWQLTYKCSANVFLTPMVIGLRNSRRKVHFVLEPLLVIHGKKATYHAHMKAIHEWSIRLFSFVNDKTWVGPGCPIYNFECSQEDKYKSGWVMKTLINDKNGLIWFKVWMIWYKFHFYNLHKSLHIPSPN